MTATTITVNLISNDGIALPWPGDKCFVMKRIVDFSVVANYLAQNQAMALFNLPAFVCAKEVGFRLITADADIATSSYLGVVTIASTGVITEVDEDGFAADVVFNGTVGYIAPDVDAAYMPNGSGGCGYKGLVDSLIIFTNKDTDTVNGAKVEFYAICIDLR